MTTVTSTLAVVARQAFNVGMGCEYSETTLVRGETTWYVVDYADEETLVEVYRYDGGRKAGGFGAAYSPDDIQYVADVSSIWGVLG